MWGTGETIHGYLSPREFAKCFWSERTYDTYRYESTYEHGADEAGRTAANACTH